MSRDGGGVRRRAGGAGWEGRGAERKRSRNLAEYAEALVDAGYDDVQFLLEMSDDKIETILTEAGMAKVGHRKRFVSCVRKLRAAAA